LEALHFVNILEHRTERIIKLYTQVKFDIEYEDYNEVEAFVKAIKSLNFCKWRCKIEIVSPITTEDMTEQYKKLFNMPR